MSDSYYEVDGAWTVTYVNAALERRTGYSRADIVGTCLWDVPGLRDTQLETALRRAMADREPLELETFLPKWGYTVRARIYPRDDGGLCVYSTEVPSRRETERRLDAAFDNVRHSVVLLRPNGIVLEANDAFLHEVEHPTSTATERIVGRRLWDLEWRALAEEVADRIREGVETAAEGTRTRDEVELGTEEEHVVYDLSFTPVERDGETLYVVFEAHDVSELRVTERTRDSLFDLSLDMVCTADFRGYLMELNPAWTATLGWSREELRARPWIEFVHPDDYDATVAVGERLFAGEDIVGFQNRYRTKDGEYRWLSWNSTVVPEADRVFCVVRDVTEQRAREAELERNSDLFERTQRISGVGAWEVDVQAQQTLWSSETKRIHEVPMEYQADVSTAVEFFHPDDRPLIQAAVEHAIETGEGWDLELRLVTAKGNERWTQAKGDAHFVDGELRYLRGTFQDITERRRRDQELRDSERYLRELYEVSADSTLGLSEKVEQLLAVGCDRFGLDVGILAHIDDEEYTVVERHAPGFDIARDDRFDLGDTYCSITVDTDDVVGLEHVEASDHASHPAYAAFGLESYLAANVVVDGQPYGTVNFSSPTPRDRPFSEHERTYVRLLSGWIGYELERELAREELACSERRLRRLIDAVPHAIVLKDEFGRYHLVNEAAAACFGLTPAEMEGKTTPEIMPATKAELVLARDDAVFAAGEPAVWTERLVRGTGEPGEFETTRLPFEEENGDQQLIAVAVDITELKRVEREVAEANDELVRRKEELEMRYSQLEFFDSLMRHDVLNALTVIRSAGEFIRDGATDEQTEQDARTIVEWSDDVVLLVRRVREVIEVLSGGIPELTPIDVRPVLEDETSRLAGAYPAASITVRSEADAVVEADDLLGEVVGNVVTNALVHNDTPEPVVDVSVEPDGEVVRIVVADNGPGITDDRKQSVFRRGETTHVKRSGAGFGLFFVDTMISAYGGRVTLEDNDPRGARFVIELPSHQ